MKEIVSKTPEIFEDPERVVAQMHTRGLRNQARIEEVYGAVAQTRMIETALQADIRVKAKDFFKDVGLAEDEIAQEHIEMFETVRANVVVASLLEKEPHLTLDQVTQRGNGIADPGRIKKGYPLIKRMMENGGIRGEDHPLYFYPPVVLEGREVSPDEFEGKVYFYGLTATGTHDLNPTPFQPDYPLLGIHANAFNTIVTQNFIVRFPWWGNVVIMVVLALLMSLVVPLFTAMRTGGIMLGVLVIYVVAAFFLFTEVGLWVDIVGSVMTLTLSYLSVTLYGYIRKEREKNFVEGAFGRFLAPSVVEQIVEHPEMLNQLGGQERVLTAFFSDVKGFSSVSEKLTPTQLVELLNEYLSAMVEVIESHGGTIDKFEGDAIIAFYGAPIPYEDHPARACLAALGMQEKLVEMREKWQREGRQLLYTRMGMNTGPMVVGNMGSMTRVDYTIMGDSVNLAARLEPGCKIYGVYTQITGATYEGAKHAIEARELDRLVVVGRSEPVTTYEILSRKGELDPKKAEIVGLYHRGLELYRDRQWDAAISYFQQALQLDPKDGPSLTYVDRCQEFKITPPPDDWQGTFQQKEK
jgi:adenylate cyclase